MGCFEDKSHDRDLPNLMPMEDLTPARCRIQCKDKGFAYSAVQYGYLCHCGDTYGKHDKIPDEKCSSKCKGDPEQTCGGFWKNAVFTTSTYQGKNVI